MIILRFFLGVLNYYYYNVYKFTGFFMEPLRIGLDQKVFFLCSQLASNRSLKVLIDLASTTSRGGLFHALIEG